MREVFEELRAQPAHAVLADLRGQLRLALAEPYSSMSASPLVTAARARGLRLEVLGTDTVEYLPFNKKTRSALVIENDELAARCRVHALGGRPMRGD
jgi:hypothetical protein